MIYVGLDVHHKSTTICIQDEKGTQMLLDKCPTTFEGFRDKLGSWLADYPETPVGMEACSKTYIVSGIIAGLGGAPRVFPADEAAGKTRSKKKKTDGRDAQDLCTNLRTGAFMREVQLPPESMRRLRSALRARQLQVKILVQATNAAKALLREYGLEGASGSMSTESAWQHRLSQTMPEFTAQLLQVYFSSFLLATEQIKALTAMLRELGDQNRSFDVVQSIPGVGEVTKWALAAHLFDISRFSSAKKVTAYTGLCPSSYDSGDRERKGRITREGPSLLRSLLVECAQHATRRNNPLNPFYRRFVVRHGHKKAIVAIAAKLTRIVYGLVKRGECFSPEALGVTWDKDRFCYVTESKKKRRRQSPVTARV